MPMTFPNAKWGSKSAYQSARADTIRRMIFAIIGQECEECGERHGLEVNHVYKRTWKPKKLSKYRRALRYWRELKAGVPLTPLCRSCNTQYRPLEWPQGQAAVTAAKTQEPF